MRVLVCGGRNYADMTTVDRVLTGLHQSGPITAIIHGNAPGADTLADGWAAFKRVNTSRYPADWKAHGRAAGMIRNQFMLKDGRPDLVVAFPGGRGTADMVRRARAAGVEVYEVEQSSNP